MKKKILKILLLATSFLILSLGLWINQENKNPLQVEAEGIEVDVLKERSPEETSIEEPSIDYNDIKGETDLLYDNPFAE